MIETEFKVVVLKLHLISVSVRSYSVFVLSNIQWRNTSLTTNCPTELNNAAICCTNCLKLIGLQSCWYQDLSYKVCVCKMQQILVFCKSFSNTSKYHGTICILSMIHKFCHLQSSLLNLIFRTRRIKYQVQINKWIAIFLIKVSEVYKGYSKPLRKSMITFPLRQFEQTSCMN